MRPLSAPTRRTLYFKTRSKRAGGDDWPAEAETMIGLRRLDNLQQLISQVVRDGVPGDVLEAGVWRGGASIFARAVLEELGEGERQIWVADSFRGLPSPTHAQDVVDYSVFDELAVSLEEVQRNFARYGFLDERVHFLVGWFKDTLPGPVEQIAVLRADGDMYESTMDILNNLYDRVTPGGYVIMDDYGTTPACAVATDEFRERNQVVAPLIKVDRHAVYWQKLKRQ